MKYMGSKNRFAKELLPIILKDRVDGQYYVEPFAGGMNMIDKVTGNRIANDFNEQLISMWKELINNKWTPKEYYTKDEYKDIMQNKDKYPTHVLGWVGFNCSYSGKYFGGFAGKVTTKTGVERNYQDEAFRNTIKQVPNLVGVNFVCGSYDEIEIPEQSIIYCDPPYQSTTGYSNDIDHDKFWQWVREMTDKGHKVFVSEYNAPDDFECVWEKQTKSSLSANGVSGGSKVSTEKLFTLNK